jgi:hypothetical protein
VAVAEFVALVVLPALRSLLLVYLVFCLALLGALLVRGARRGLLTPIKAKGRARRDDETGTSP